MWLEIFNNPKHLNFPENQIINLTLNQHLVTMLNTHVVSCIIISSADNVEEVHKSKNAAIKPKKSKKSKKKINNEDIVIAEPEEINGLLLIILDSFKLKLK